MVLVIRVGEKLQGSNNQLREVNKCLVEQVEEKKQL